MEHAEEPSIQKLLFFLEFVLQSDIVMLENNCLFCLPNQNAFDAMILLPDQVARNNRRH